MKHILVIGLGQFGLGLVKALRTKHVEVVAVDMDEKRVQAVASDVQQALCFDATNEEALARLAPRTRDVCVCATGDQSKEAAIICTAILKQLGAKRIIARANDELHARILKIVGADEVINPEWEFGRRFANHIVHEHILQQMSLGADLVVTEFEVPHSYYNKNLINLDLRRQFGATVIAVRKGNSGEIVIPDPADSLEAGDFLVVVAREGTVAGMLGENTTD